MSRGSRQSGFPDPGALGGAVLGSGPLRGRVTLPCAQCGEPFSTQACEANRGRRFCSKRCARLGDQPEVKARRAEAMRAQDRRGTQNPNFRHGKHAAEHSRAFTLERKGETVCRNCGGVGPASRPLHLHHSVPRDVEPEGVGEILNGIPLCPSCHKGWHKGGTTIYRDVFTADEWDVVQTLAPPGWLDLKYPERPNA